MKWIGLPSSTFGETCKTEGYRRFIASPTLNNSKKKVDFFWKLSLNVVEIL